MTGTARAFSLETQAVIEARMGAICAGVGAAFGAEVGLKYTRGYPPTINSHAAELETLRAAARGVVGAENLRTDVQTCGAEDFSYFLTARPGAFFFVGAALPGELKPHHRSDFDFDEEAMQVTAAIFVHLITDVLGGAST